MDPLPPLNAVRAFEVAARCLSFTRAAKELHVTPAAVSQQMRLLEEWLGMPLFQRAHRKLSLTQAGQSYLPQIQEGLGCIALATKRLLSSEETSTLSVGAMASFASKWLVPRLGRFRDRHPEITVCLSTANNLVDSEFEDKSERLVDFDQRNPEVTIRYGRGAWVGLFSERLLCDKVFPVCNPDLLQGDTSLSEPADLAHHTLLHDVLPEDWNMWLTTAGVPAVDGTVGPMFSHSHDMIAAAIHGQGVALGRSTLVADDLAAGRLVRPFEHSIDAAFSYYVVCPATVVDRPKIAAFLQWLRLEAASTA